MKIAFYNYTKVEHPHLIPIAQEAIKRGHKIKFLIHEPKNDIFKIKKNLEEHNLNFTETKNLAHLQKIINKFNYTIFSEPMRIKVTPSGSKAIQIYHGIANKGGHYIVEFEKLWFKSFVAGKHEYNELKKIVPEKIKDCHIVGYSKFDYKQKTNIKKSLIPTCLYIPTWNDQYSSLKYIGEKICNTNLRIIVKLHNHTIERNNYWEKFYKENKNIIYSTKEVNNLLKYCDVVLSDVSSAMFEAIAFNKPIIAFTSPNANLKIGQIEYEFRKNKIINEAFSWEEVLNYLSNIKKLKITDYKIKKHLYKYKSGASQKILNILEKSL